MNLQNIYISLKKEAFEYIFLTEMATNVHYVIFIPEQLSEKRRSELLQSA